MAGELDVVVGDAFGEWPARWGRSADVAIFSPPYNFGAESLGGTRSGYMYGGAGRDSKSKDDYIADLVRLFHNLDECVRENGVVLMNINWSTNTSRIRRCGPMLVIGALSAIDAETPWTVATAIYWDKHTSTPSHFGRQTLSNRVEPVYVFARKAELATYHTNKIATASTSDRRWNRSFYRAPEGIPFVNYVESRADTDRWTGFPAYHVDMVKRLLSMYCPPGGTVVDPFHGSGTTTLAALDTGRRALGMEINPDFVARSRARIAKRSEPGGEA